MMNDIFSNFMVQREDILTRIAESLQLDTTRRQRMESAYKALCTIINEDQGFFKGMEIDIYPQGSVAIGTTVKPFQGDEFDLDVVLHIKRGYSNFTPLEIYNALLKKLEGDGRYSHMVEKKRRCVRLNYAGDFHMDILPGCMIVISDEKNIMVPDRELKDWTISNPKGYVEWFLSIANLSKKSELQAYYNRLYELKAEIQELPDDDFLSKKPLQSAIQLIKRYRDIYFEHKSEFATSSIIITTIAAGFYRGENSIFGTIDSILTRIQQESRLPQFKTSRLKVTNPVNPNEDFSEKWDSDPRLYQHFLAFVKDLYEKWQMLKKDFSESALTYETLFGENIYKGAIRQQLQKLGQKSSNKLIQSGTLIIGANMRTDRDGNINLHTGERNERHRDFGDNIG
ncbi:nucleotidyltransferase domain-containing protein [Pinibacter soli]|uniref:Nucleotidyltransferase n=1 Tax=Pinibacter soli TaxID=3044211 RepID=A0ABT6RFV3_9BACT|nr:nucleotidyltransferase [Pinibacter soli]MDI3321418.1 nucleotidyltransferase [Pinibacter soli]